MKNVITQKIEDREQAGKPLQGLTIYIHTYPNLGSFNYLSSSTSAENDWEFYTIVEDYIEKFSKSWEELSKM